MDMPTGDEPMMSKQAAMAAGLPPSKQMQSEESLPALDDEERKAVQMRARDRSTHATDGRATRRSPRRSRARRAAPENPRAAPPACLAT